MKTSIAIVVISLLVLAACLGDGGGTKVVMQFRVEGAAMLPSFPNGMFVDVLDYGSDAPQRGDVIVFHAPMSLNRDFIKRVVGLPGDTIDIMPETGEVLLNGEVLEEPYVQGTTSCAQQCGPWIVPDDSYFVMGDNRENSSDSRQGWFVPAPDAVGWVESSG